MSEIRQIEADNAQPWPELNPRRRHDPARHAELVASIREQGVLQPVIAHDRHSEVSNVGATPRYWIIAGERRWRAALEADLEEVPAVVGEFTEAQALEIALVENLQRADMSVLEEARGFQRMIAGGMTQAKLAERIGIDRSTVANRVRLLQLPDVVLELVESGVIQPSWARDYLLPFAGIPEAARGPLYDAVAERLERGDWRPESEPPTGQDVYDVVAEVAMALSLPLGSPTWDDNERPEFDVAEHKDCDCGGPKFEYQFHRPSVRCFDPEWWQAAQARAKEQLAASESDSGPESGADAAAAVTRMSPAAFRERYRFDSLELLAATPAKEQRHWQSRRLVDAAELEDAPIVVLEYESGDRTVLVVDDAAAQRARGVVDRARRVMLQERRDAQAAADLEAADQASVDHEVIVALLTERPYDDILLAIGRELGMEMGKHGQVKEAIRKLSPYNVYSLAKVIALRAREGRLAFYHSDDPVEAEVEGKLWKRYGPGIRKLRKHAIAALEETGSEAEVEGEPAGAAT